MQARKKFKPRLFVNFNLVDAVDDNNFYKRIRNHLNLDFIYGMTKKYYSHTGRPSLDPVVFFKIVLIGYLENICSDRALERMLQNRLDLRLFIGYDIDESIPDHSTICKTRQRLPVEVFTAVFNSILKMCIESGLVQGAVQSVDTAYINANASLDKMAEVKMIEREPDQYLNEILEQDINKPTEEEIALARKRATSMQKRLEHYTEQRRLKYTELQGGSQKKKNKRRFLSNATHQSKTDPDARIAKKNGKPRMLCYTSLLTVDTSHNVITNMSAELSSKKDSRLLIKAVKETKQKLAEQKIEISSVLADAGFSSGENYKCMEDLGIEAFIPIHGQFKEKRDDFKYYNCGNYYKCKNGKRLAYLGRTISNGYLRDKYVSSKKDCNLCPFRKECAGANGIKIILNTIYRPEYLRMIDRLKSESGKRSYALRMQTVEPVFGSLQQYYGLRWINTRGIASAKKIMLMAAAAFNLKKWFKNTVLIPSLNRFVGTIDYGVRHVLLAEICSSEINFKQYIILGSEKLRWRVLYGV